MSIKAVKVKQQLNMCKEYKSIYTIWNTKHIACGFSLYVFFVSHKPFQMVTRSHPGPDPAQNQQLNCFAAHLSALSSIRAFTERVGVSNDLSCNSSIFDHSRLLMLLHWLRFMLNLNDCLRKKKKKKSTSTNTAASAITLKSDTSGYLRYNTHLNTIFRGNACIVSANY